ncbi:segregation/condensation protein A [Candidatus Acetothermia bacterium]|nr:segregation/condensation protein A [Candidatus Acetothermia bacterium]
MNEEKRFSISIAELAEAGWKQTLLSLTADMDPWNIDISELVERYRIYVRNQYEFDFEIPGRMVVTCSVLLRTKAVALDMAYAVDRDKLLEEVEEAVAVAEAEAIEDKDDWKPPFEPEHFTLPVQRRPHRQVRVPDLKHALLDAIRVSRRRSTRLREQIIDNPFADYALEEENVYERINSLLAKIKEFLSGRRILSFFRLLTQGDKKERVERFLEVLHLDTAGLIRCEQEEFFGDILITIPTGKDEELSGNGAT